MIVMDQRLDVIIRDLRMGSILDVALTHANTLPERLRLRGIDKSVNSIIMENQISATELARSLGDILGRIRYKGESFTVVRNGRPVARLTPVREPHSVTVGEVFAAWKAGMGDDPELAADLERVRAADRAPGNPWG